MRIGVMGAGSIGCYVGGRLAAAGADVRFVGRASLGTEIAEHGLHLNSYRDDPQTIAAVSWSEDVASLKDVDLVLVSVKGLATESVAHELKGVIGDGVPVLSLQNGVSNAAVLKSVLGERVWPCMVPFNVVRQGEGRFHQGTSGDLITASDAPEAARQVLASVGLKTHDRMDEVLWGKLLINANNALNALSNIPLAQQLRDPVWRGHMAAVISEGLDVCRAAGIQPVAFLPIPLPWVVRVLRLPTWLFTRVARSMVAVDPEARSSMWEDLERGRKTEIDLLNGEIVTLGRKHGVPTPMNQLLVEAIHSLENGGARSQWVAEL